MQLVKISCALLLAASPFYESRAVPLKKRTPFLKNLFGSSTSTAATATAAGALGKASSGLGQFITNNLGDILSVGGAAVSSIGMHANNRKANSAYDPMKDPLVAEALKVLSQPKANDHSTSGKDLSNPNQQQPGSSTTSLSQDDITKAMALIKAAQEQAAKGKEAVVDTNNVVVHSN